jgi:hypothetical protein
LRYQTRYLNVILKNCARPRVYTALPRGKRDRLRFDSGIGSDFQNQLAALLSPRLALSNALNSIYCALAFLYAHLLIGPRGAAALNAVTMTFLSRALFLIKGAVFNEGHCF